jgi:serine/threonine protein kinase
MKDMAELLGLVPWPAGKIIGDIYEIREVIGQGGFGLVYRAHDHATHQDIAVKVPLGREEFDERGRKRVLRFVDSPSAKAGLVEEVRAWIDLAHPHVVRAFDVRDDASSDYLPAIFMDLCAGGSLYEKIYGRKPLTLVEGLEVAIQVCWGMEYIHQQGLVHRDLKPANVLLTGEGNQGPGKAMVSDLGLAKALGMRGVAPLGESDGGKEADWWVTASQAGGTPSHMPPEQWENGEQLGPSSDVYAFGVMLYELFCRRLPFEAGNDLWAWKRAHCEEAVPDPRQWGEKISGELAAVMMVCVAKEPGLRPPGFGEMDEQLSRLYRQESGREYTSLRPKPGAQELTAESRNRQAWARLRLGSGAQRRGDLGFAEREYKQAELIFRELGNLTGVHASLGRQAELLRIRGKLKEALELHRESEEQFRAVENRHALSMSLGNQGVILRAMGQLTEAMEKHKEEEALCRELEFKEGISRSLCAQALILHAWGQLDEAIAVHKKDELICRESGDQMGFYRSLGNQAVILWQSGLLDEAMDMFRKVEQFHREIGDRANLSRSLGNQALILLAWGRLEDAMRLLSEQESLSRDVGDLPELIKCLTHQAQGLRFGHRAEAVAKAEEALRLCSQYGLALAPQVRLLFDALRYGKW